MSKIVSLCLAALTALLGAVLAVGGARLLSLGGSPYYVLCGSALIVCSVLSWRGHRWGPRLYGLVFLVSIGWALFEVGLQPWGLAARLGLLALIGFGVLLAALPSRTKFGRPLALSEWLVFALVGITLIGTGFWLLAPSAQPAEEEGSHVRVDMLLVALPKRYAIRLEQLVDVVGLGISAVMAVYGARAVVNAYATNMIQFKTWTVAEWILLLPIPLGCGLLAIEFVLRIFRAPGFVSDEYKIADRPSL